MVLHKDERLRKPHYDFSPKNKIFNQSFFFNTFFLKCASAPELCLGMRQSNIRLIHTHLNKLNKSHFTGNNRSFSLTGFSSKVTQQSLTNCAMFASKATLVDKVTQKEKKAFINSLMTTIPKWIQYSVLSKNEISFYISPKYLVPFLFYLKNHANTQFKMLIDITAVDYPSRTLRFQVVYNILSISYNARLKVKTCIDEVSLLSSVTTLYSSAGWWEREVWDMFGIFFSNHPDLRRILTDYGFQGHPLRKDFPLSGFVEVRYDDSEKRVITEPIEVTQEFRYFDFASPWEQIEKI